MIRKFKIKDYNFRLILWLVAISILGVMLVGSADASLQSRQLMGVILGFILMVIFSLMDYSWLLNFQWIIYGLNLLLLIGVRILGDSAGGATRWIEIAGIRFQPTELTKIFIILFFAKFFLDHEENINSFKVIVQGILLLALPLILVYVQPDLKNTITLILLFCVLIYIAGLSYKVIFGIILAVVPLLVIFLTIIVQPDQTLIKDYQRNRIMAWLYPENEEYQDNITQQENSITAIGSGQLTGKGLNNNEVSSANKGNFVSQIQTDFIFAVAGEELGFLGTSGIIILLLLIDLECILMGRRAKDMAGKMICCGVATVVSFQSFINICVATGMMPNTGTPLPFLSYGLTSLVSLYIGMGVVLNVGLQSKIHITGERT
ncbi:MAG: FtsW/RodA/SpoVE family cell cycle protein [Lachnospiraceae bacterium]|nr:FtsW/RodA/SpoVE family cell cycle protein [Lachnospiraceae bacterium]